MDRRNFFYFGLDIPANRVQAGLVGHDIDFDYDKLIRGDYAGFDFPLVFKREYGKKYHDIMGVGCPGLYLISNRIKKLLEDNQCTGWKVFPVQLYDKPDAEVPGYWGLSFCGRCGPVFYKTADIIEKRWVPHGPICRYYKGIYVDRWDGSDFFMPEGAGHVFVSKKVADLFTSQKIKYVYFENFTETEFNVTDVLPSKVRDASA